MATVDQIINLANQDLGLSADSPIDINSPYNVDTGYSASVPDYSGGADTGAGPTSFGSGLGDFLSGLMSYSLKRDQINAQRDIATHAASVYPYRAGVLPAAGSGGMVNLLVIGALIFVGLKAAKAI